MKKDAKKRKVPLAVVILVWLLAIIAVLATVSFSIVKQQISPVDSQEEGRIVTVKVPSGMTVNQLSLLLKEENLIHSSQAFYYAARFNVFDRNAAFSLKSGVYEVSSAMSLKDIYFLVQSGSPENLTVHIPEGLTIRKVARILEENNVCSAQSFIESCSNPDIISSYGIPSGNMAGYIFPDTYCLNPEMDSDAVLKIMADNFFQKLSEISGAQKLTPEELYENVKMASVVEREYKIPSEAPLIASVFWNRISHHDGLYSCATIEYIITEIQGKPHPERITYDDLKIDSPFNTYLYWGLPPEPISNPGLVALEATINAPETDYYYFVLTDPDAGSHTFSKTFDEHKAANNLNYTRK